MWQKIWTLMNIICAKFIIQCSKVSTKWSFLHFVLWKSILCKFIQSNIPTSCFFLNVPRITFHYMYSWFFFFCQIWAQLEDGLTICTYCCNIIQYTFIARIWIDDSRMLMELHKYTIKWLLASIDLNPLGNWWLSINCRCLIVIISQAIHYYADFNLCCEYHENRYENGNVLEFLDRSRTDNRQLPIYSEKSLHIFFFYMFHAKYSFSHILSDLRIHFNALRICSQIKRCFS